MQTVPALFAEVDALVRSSLSEHDLTVVLPKKLAELRTLYSKHRAEFAVPIVERLQFAAQVPDIVQAFLEALEEEHYVTHREDAEEIVGRFEDIRDSLRDCAFGRRAAKEARQVLERYQSLPTRARAIEERHLRELERQASVCPVCKGKLTLRESKYGLFWGCRIFPSCLGKAPLTAAQAKALRE